jgi:acyl dehydratase
MARARNVCFDALEVGMTAHLEKAVTQADIRDFARLSGDTNPIHIDPEYALSTRFEGTIAHGMLVGAHISTALATKLPGPGTIFLSQSLRFESPVRPGDRLVTTLEVTHKRADKPVVTLACRVENAAGQTVVSGEAVVLASWETIEVDLPDAEAL